MTLQIAARWNLFYLIGRLHNSGGGISCSHSNMCTHGSTGLEVCPFELGKFGTLVHMEAKRVE